MANDIFRGLETIDSEVATVKRVRKKNTLVARWLWQDLCNVGSAREPWQLDGLTVEAVTLLNEVDDAGAPVSVGHRHKKGAAMLEARLLVYSTSVHTDSGNHVRSLLSWRAWATSRNLRCLPANGLRSRGRFDEIVYAWADRPQSRLVPWRA